MKFFFWKKKVENSKRIFYPSFIQPSFIMFISLWKKKKNFIHSEILFH